jgi:hypothetical protein
MLSAQREMNAKTPSRQGKKEKVIALDIKRS